MQESHLKDVRCGGGKGVFDIFQKLCRMKGATYTGTKKLRLLHRDGPERGGKGIFSRA